MASKADFTADEWQALLEGVMMSGIAVTAADPSGLWGSLKEGFANAGALAKAKVDEQTNGLVRDIAADFATSEGRKIARDGLREKLSGAKPEQVTLKSVEGLRRARVILDDKAPEDSEAVRAWLRDTSQRVAEASKEGGFLGFGGETVSEAEKATLNEISGALNMPA